MIDLIRKGRLLQSFQHLRYDAGTIVVDEGQQLFALDLRGNVALSRRVPGTRRGLVRDLEKHRTSSM
jgi:hypothetical protein